MDEPREECPGGENHGTRTEADTKLGHHTADAIAFQHQIVHRLLKQGEVRLVFQAAANRFTVEHAVGLRTGGAHCRPLARIQYTKLDSCLIGRLRHGAAEGVNFLDQMPFADSAYGRVARHLAQGFDAVCQQQSALSCPG